MYQNGGKVNPGGVSPKTLTDGLSRSSHPFRKACGKNSVIPTEAQRSGGTLCFHGTAHRVGRTLLSAALDSADLSRAQPSRQNPAAPIINALHPHNPAVVLNEVKDLCSLVGNTCPPALMNPWKGMASAMPYELHKFSASTVKAWHLIRLENRPTLRRRALEAESRRTGGNRGRW
jgi:hypothetical protein